ncbi:MAG: ABC transporter permease subunit, partial [Planctomycetota bacterium]
MWKAIARFEFAYHLKQPLFYLAAATLFLMGLGLVTSDLGLTFGKAPTQIDRNAPFVIVNCLTFMSLVGLFVITAYVAGSVLRDFEQNTHMLFFSRPVKKFDFLLGRFAGSMAISFTLFLMLALGLMAGHIAPWQDPERIAPFRLVPYAYGLLVMVLPNLLMMGALFFAV